MFVSLNSVASGARTTNLSRAPEFTPVFSGTCIAQYILFCVMFCRSLLVLSFFPLSIVLSVLLWHTCTTSDYPFGFSNFSSHIACCRRQALTNSCFTHTLRLVVCSSRTTAVSVDSVFIYWGKGNGVKAVLKTLHHNVVISFSTPSGNDWTWQKEYHSTCFTDTQRRLRCITHNLLQTRLFHTYFTASYVFSDTPCCRIVFHTSSSEKRLIDLFINVKWEVFQHFSWRGQFLK